MRHKTFEFMSRGKTLFAQRWWPDSYPKAVVVFVHTWAGHSSRDVALIEKLTDLGYACYGFDFIGHGHTRGKRAHISDFSHWVSDLSTFVEVVKSELRSVSFFLYGHGVGATAAANYVTMGQVDIDGIIFSNGSLAVGQKISKFHIVMAWIIGGILPVLPVASLPPNSISTLPEQQTAYDEDPLVFHGKMSAGTGKALLMASMRIPPRLNKITVPFLALYGRQNSLVMGSEQLYQQASSTDKTLKSYDALHDLLHDACAEQVMTDIVDWLEARVAQHH